MQKELKSGTEFNNLIELCEYIGWNYNGKHPDRIRKRMSIYFSFHKEGQRKIIIDDVFCETKDMIQRQVKERLTFKYNIGDVVNVASGNIIILDKFILKKGTCNRASYRCKCLNCGYEYNIYEYLIDAKIGCGCCDNKVVVAGINDIWTTDKNLGILLANKSDGYKYTRMSSKNVDWKCPVCGNILKSKSIRNVANRGLSCPCSKTKSLPNRVMYWVLKNLNIEFEDEKTFSWSKTEDESKRYDFYLTCTGTIIEMNGAQHYREAFDFTRKSLSEQQANDKYKKNLAKENGIKHYITINCSQSNFEYIKNNIIQSALSNIFDLSKIDWDYVLEKSHQNIITEISKEWNAGCRNTKEIASKLGFKHSGSILKFIHIADELGYIDFNKDEIMRDAEEKSKNTYYQNNATPYYCPECQLYFGSISICAGVMKDREGCKFCIGNIKMVADGNASHHHRFTFVRVTKEEFNNAKSQYPDMCYGNFFKINSKKSA